MKKTLVALAALAATGVFAQSSLTVFGTADAGLAIGNGDVANVIGLRNSGLASSALGFRGVEDLGGGMKASFHLEGSANTDSGAGQPSNTNNQASGALAGGPAVQAGNQGFTFGRRAYVALGGGWGEVRLGREYTPHFWNYTFYDPFGTNGVGTTLALAYSAGDSTNVRASNAINYVGNFGGFGVNLMTYFGEQPSNVVTTAITNSASAGSGGSMRLSYDNGPVSVGLGIGQTTVGSAATHRVKYTNVGASYNFGFMSLMGNWVRESNDQVVGASADGSAWTLGATAPVGSGTLKGSLSHRETNAAGAPGHNQFALGYVYGLSKRTQVYATLASRTGTGTPVAATTTLNGSTGTANSTATGMDLGVRHSF